MRKSCLRDADDDHSPAVGLQVKKGLLEMVPSPFSGNYTHLVCSQTLNGNITLVSLQELGLHGRIRHEDESNDRKDQGEACAEEENDLIPILDFDIVGCHWLRFIPDN
jgi:hypothetical protein